jgi:hypothetical protein
MIITKKGRTRLGKGLKSSRVQRGGSLGRRQLPRRKGTRPRRRLKSSKSLITRKKMITTTKGTNKIMKRFKSSRKRITKKK